MGSGLLEVGSTLDGLKPLLNLFFSALGKLGRGSLCVKIFTDKKHLRQ
jgi:hypothetical protein